MHAEPGSPLLALLAERIHESDPSEREEACRHLETMAQTMARDSNGFGDDKAPACSDVCVNVVRDLAQSLGDGRLAFRTEPELLAYVRRAVENRLKQWARSEDADEPAPRTPPTSEPAAAATVVAPAEPPEHPPQPVAAKPAEMLPQLDALVEVNRSYARLVEALTEQLSHATKGSGSLHGELARLGEASNRQIEFLASLRHQLEINNRTRARMTHAVEDLRRTLERMRDSGSGSGTQS
ncbi:MAG: hypothetical protein ACYSXF_02450 [Planctomycetota bacterium]